MNRIALEGKAASKVIAKACTWADRRKAAEDAAPAEKKRAVGRYKVSKIELAEAVEKFRQEGER